MYLRVSLLPYLDFQNQPRDFLIVALTPNQEANALSQRLLAYMFHEWALPQVSKELEKIYPATLHSAQRKAMIEFAKEEAARLGVDIVSRLYGDPSTPYNQEIIDYGGSADEYVDALGFPGIFRDFVLKNMPLL